MVSECVLCIQLPAFLIVKGQGKNTPDLSELSALEEFLPLTRQSFMHLTYKSSQLPKPITAMMMMRMTSSPIRKVPPPPQAAIHPPAPLHSQTLQEACRATFPMPLRPISSEATPIQQPFDHN
jgi:hypothetical protein